MADDSGGLGSARMPDGRPLFEFGDLEQRRIGVLHSILLVLGAFVVAALFVSIGGGALEAVGVEPGSPAAAVVDTATNFIGLLVVPLGYLAWREEWALVGFRRPSTRDLATIVVGAVVLIVFMNAAELLLSALGFEPAQNAAVESGRENPELFLYYIPVVLLLNAPAEELLFRGLVQGLLRRAFGVLPGIVGAAAIFGLVHYSALVAQGSAGAYIVIALGSGVILGILYEYTENLLVPIVVHAVWNCLVYATLYLEATGVL
ncbi:CPBP family intramembrane metalloprotease [Halovenus sp. WSH3]|uniref:CPBP family intramembrane metalloprotease n=1 Tax=Halovenus carboxidivorans TaxID=2692199 RepID=A0A6B0T3H7_9EURY|nr:type II CAAX endopeptidase family protein [Halovenus carboxidivorans]MXR52585.1 CPBP family intramembrane metalloprotease [Halovenus carboxidivorans]